MRSFPQHDSHDEKHEVSEAQITIRGIQQVPTHCAVGVIVLSRSSTPHSHIQEKPCTQVPNTVMWASRPPRTTHSQHRGQKEVDTQGQSWESCLPRESRRNEVNQPGGKERKQKSRIYRALAEGEEGNSQKGIITVKRNSSPLTRGRLMCFHSPHPLPQNQPLQESWGKSLLRKIFLWRSSHPCF